MRPPLHDSRLLKSNGFSADKASILQGFWGELNEVRNFLGEAYVNRSSIHEFGRSTVAHIFSAVAGVLSAAEG
jgi:hypothetical protein